MTHKPLDIQPVLPRFCLVLLAGCADATRKESLPGSLPAQAVLPGMSFKTILGRGAD